MNKSIFLTLLVILTFTLIGCTTSQSQQIPNELTENNTFNHQLFSIVLPTPYDIDGRWIKSQKDNQNILEFSHTKTEQDLDINQVTALEKDNAKLMCEQTDSCRRIVNIEPVDVGGQEGIKVFYEADSIDQGEILKWHAYFVYYKGNLFKFQPNGIIGDDAIKSISLK